MIRLAIACLYLCLASIAHACKPFQPDSTAGAIRCEPVTHHRCIALGTNTTYPNAFNHSTSKEASRFLDNLDDLFEANCSAELLHFLCFATFPFCSPGFRKVEPCRELCIAVRESCTNALNRGGREWPVELNCNHFPQHTSRLCVWHGNTPCDSTPNALSTSSVATASPQGKPQDPLANCTGHLVRYPNWSLAQYGDINRCQENCHGVYLTTSQQNFTLVWITIWSLVCLLLSVMTFLTCVVNFKQIQSPESSVYYIALCHAFIALAYTTSIALGKENVICNAAIKNKLNESGLIVDGIRFPFCALLFSLLYYFTLCSWMWWAILNLEWLVCTIRPNSIGTKWRICSHVVGWGVPMVFLLAVLGTRMIEGDPILRTCWVRKYNEVPFLITPLVTVVVLSSTVVLIAFTRVANTQRTFKESLAQRSDVSHITGLNQVRMYCTVFLFPMGILLCCYWYEFWYRWQWEHSYLECMNNSLKCTSPLRPLFAVFMTKFTATVSMGVISVLWVLKKSSLSAWKKACCVCFSTERTVISQQSIRQLDFTGERYATQFSWSETSV